MVPMSNVTNIQTNDKGIKTGLIDGVKHVEIECAQGHSYWRVSQRGKRPQFCPDHAPATETTEKSDVAESAWAPTEDEIANIYPLLKGQDVNKVRYYDEQLHKPIWTGRGEDADENSDNFIISSTYRTRQDHYRLKAERTELLSKVARHAGRNLVTA